MKAAYLYRGEVMHRRKFPLQYHFQYRVFSFFVDIDQLETLETQQRWFSHNRFNVFSLYDEDHGARNSQTWREWIDPFLDQRGLSEAKHKIYLLCFPRILGYSFNPLSLWFCYDADEQLRAVIAEVSNTFKEHHHYVLHNDNQTLALPVKARQQKDFYVSPFVNMDQEYRFTIDAPREKLRILIHQYEAQKLMLIATQHGKRDDFSTRNLWRCFWQMPLMTLKVIFFIHWQAVKIILKGGKFHRHHAKKTPS